MKAADFQIKTLGKAKIKSPLMQSPRAKSRRYQFVQDIDRVIYENSLEELEKCFLAGNKPVSFEKAGPRELLYFEPAKTKVGIVTCGGLCPGLNNVIRSIVNQLHYRYGIDRVVGFKYGYEGLIPEYNHDVIELTPQLVKPIHLQGGTILGSSRGLQNVADMVDTLERLNINILFCIGGDGTLRGAHAIYEEIQSRNIKIAIGGIPKTIDNDIDLIEKSFGFETAFSIATDVIRYTNSEAEGAYNGITLIKLMGRDSGFIAAHAALAVQEVNFVLIPEMKFDLEGANGFLEALKKRLEARHHAVVVVAEGAGQHLFEDKTRAQDASGNIKHKDIGLFLKDKISTYFNEIGFRHSLKYVDPSYTIRSAPAQADDSKFCSLLAQNAVHAAMAGKTDFVAGNWNNEFTLLPIEETVSQRKKIDIEGELWWNILEATGQPESMVN